jgi:hypothetical protein
MNRIVAHRRLQPHQLPRLPDLRRRRPPLTGRGHYRGDGPGRREAAAEAERVRTRLQSQVDERRNPTARATVNQLLDGYLELLDVEPTTQARYEGIIRVQIRPALGHLPLAKLDGDLLTASMPSSVAAGTGARAKTRTRSIRTQRENQCDESCVIVPCKPLSASSYPRDALDPQRGSGPRRPLALARPEPDREHGATDTGARQPRSPAPAEAARLLNAAWEDPDWGAFVWTAMTTGARRGELCSLKREDVDLDTGTLFVRTSLKLVNGRLVRRPSTMIG